MFQRLRKYYHHCRYWLISLFSTDPYSLKIKSLEDRIMSLRKQLMPVLSTVTFADDFMVNKSAKEAAIFQPNIPENTCPSMVTMRRERAQRNNLIGDYIGEYYAAMSRKEYDKAQSIFNKIASFDTTALDSKAAKRINNFISKNKK